MSACALASPSSSQHVSIDKLHMPHVGFRSSAPWPQLSALVPRLHLSMPALRSTLMVAGGSAGAGGGRSVEDDISGHKGMVNGSGLVCRGSRVIMYHEYYMPRHAQTWMCKQGAYHMIV